MSGEAPSSPTDCILQKKTFQLLVMEILRRPRNHTGRQNAADRRTRRVMGGQSREETRQGQEKDCEGDCGGKDGGRESGRVKESESEGEKQKEPNTSSM